MHRLFIIRALAGIGLLTAAGAPVLSQAQSARDVLERFCELDAHGEQLAPDGWQNVVALFATPGAPRRDEITIVRDFVVSRPRLEKGKAEFYVEYIQLGSIELSQLRFFPLPSVKVRAGFYVIRQSGPRSGGALGRVEEPVEWRIEGSVPEPHVTVDTAIRYTTELRANTRDATTRKNADKTLAALKGLR